MPLSMLMFFWTSEEAVRYHSIVAFVNGGLGMVVHLSYMFAPFMRRFADLLPLLTQMSQTERENRLSDVPSGGARLLSDHIPVALPHLEDPLPDRD